MASYAIRPFQTCTLMDEGMLVVSRKSSHIVQDPRMKEIILSLRNTEVVDEENSPKLSEEEIDFLAGELGILQQRREKKFGYERLVVLSDHSAFSQFFIEAVSNNGLRTIDCVTSIDELQGEDFVLVVFQDMYDPQRMKDIYEWVKEKENVTVLSSYILGSVGYIDNLYTHGEGRPCHFCNLGEIKGEHARRLTEQEQSFFLIHNYILENNLPVNTTVNLSAADYALFSKKIGQKVKPLFSPDGPTLEVEKLQFFDRYDFENDRGQSDVTLHWNYCDCLKESL